MRNFKKLTGCACFMVILLLALALFDVATIRIISGTTWVKFLTQITYVALLSISWVIIASLWDDLKIEKRKNKKERRKLK